jgi:hypothetical protein
MSHRPMLQHGPDGVYPSRWLMPQHGSNGDNMSRWLMPQHGPDEDYPSRWMMPQHGSNGDNTSHRLMPQHGPDGVHLPRWSMPQHGPNGGSLAMSWNNVYATKACFVEGAPTSECPSLRAATMMKRQYKARKCRKHGATLYIAHVIESRST